MRDPYRIQPMMLRMGELWEARVPDWRFGQLMYNFFASIGDPFHYEDDELMAGFEAYMNGTDPKEAIRNHINTRLEKYNVSASRNTDR